MHILKYEKYDSTLDSYYEQYLIKSFLKRYLLRLCVPGRGLGQESASAEAAPNPASLAFARSGFRVLSPSLLTSFVCAGERTRTSMDYSSSS